MNERVQAVLQAAEENAELKAALGQAGSPEEFVRVAAAAGLTVTVEDLQDATAADASDAELDSVGAGNTFGDCQTIPHCGTWFGLC